jgi:hypothetical protein
MTMRRGAAAILALAVAAATALGVMPSGASFSAQTSNPSNSIAAASSFPGIRVASGAFTGTGVDNRAVTGVGFKPDVVIVKSDDNSGVAEIRTSTMTGDATKPMTGATALTANLIQSLDSDGFTLGSNNAVNRSGRAYHWLAFKAFSGQMTLGTYTGNGTAGHAITGLGFSPEYAIVMAATAQRADQRMAPMARSYQFDGDTGSTTAITSLDSNGFTLGTDAEVNQSGTTYHYVAWNQNVDEMKTASYTATGAAHSVTGVGFQPSYVIVHAMNTTGAAREGAQRAAALTGTASQLFTATANEATGITALQSDGFQVGTSVTVNNATTGTYAYVAFKDKP